MIRRAWAALCAWLDPDRVGCRWVRETDSDDEEAL